MWQNKNVRLILSILGVILLGYLLWNVRVIIYYFFTAAIIAFLARPMVKLLNKIKIKSFTLPSWLKATVVLTIFVLIFVGFFKLIIPTVANQSKVFSEIDGAELVEKIQPSLTWLTEWMVKLNIDQKEVEATIMDQISQLFTVGEINTYIKGIIDGLSTTLIGIFSVLFIAFFLIKDGSIVDNVIQSLTPDRYQDKINAIFNGTKELLTRYFVGVVLQISIIMIVLTIGLTILGVKNALLIGLVAGIFNIIPYLGPILGGSLGLALAVTSQLEHDPNLVISNFLLVAIIPFVVAQMLDNFVLQPFIFSNSVRAHPLEIFMVILAASSLGGIMGMILAVPFYSFLRIVAKEFFAGYKVVQGLTKNL